MFTLLLVFSSVIGTLSCAASPDASVQDASVQVWEGDELVATGIIVGDGSQAVTILGYRDSIPDDLYIVYRNSDRYEASVQRIDFRTGATLLQIEGGTFPVAVTGEDLLVTTNQTVLAFGWSRPLERFEETNDGKRGVYGEPEFTKTTVVTATNLTATTPGLYEPPQSFRIRFENHWGNIGQSNIITDENGAVLGFVGVGFWGLIPPPSPPGMLPPVVSISSMLNLLSENAGQQLWAMGPSGYNFTRPGSESAYGQAPDTYLEVAGELQKLLDTIGDPLSVAEAQEDYSMFPFSPGNGNALVAVYASPVTLQAASGTSVRAKWIVMRWNIPGKENHLIYGTELYEPEGAFTLTGDFQPLASISHS